MTRLYSIIFTFLELLGWLEIDVSNEIQPNPNLLISQLALLTTYKDYL
ncbi:hypothetical protein H6G76_10495 [Nostoc sp. FACHB-152]|nr:MULTISPECIES: hypothetical protein [unclassified Nostoc]MBD2447592.1 hypothetical protein [Nostoc sp. FACHB-152]MBD2469364.1 hypothetical protein [Nostoc sp. FACHB-145]